MKSVLKGGFSTELLYILGIIAISSAAIFVKWSQAEVSVIAMYRMFITDLLLIPLLWKYRTEFSQLTLRQLGMLSVSGIALGLHFLLWMASLRYTTVASSTVILTLEPIIVMLGSFYLFRLRSNLAMRLGMAVALAGSLAISIGDFTLSGSALAGDIMSFLSVLAVSAHLLIGKRMREKTSAYVYNFSVFAFAGIFLAAYNAVNEIPFGGYSEREWGLFLLLALIPTLFGHYLFNWLLKYMNASAVSMAVLGEPVVASLLAWLLLNERLTCLQLIAGVFIIAGVWVFIRYGRETDRS
ncbi:DMT family transporter [Paenibacillus sp. YPG26]|uniref:DMT family transporter n=1 Tax=Paenibacillus sp. YPG26 TaxID=2878915 RepID=UPI0020420B0B|nr:DMT family transporter [Paenibacillus sp. YPG26]USB34392.1 DMT family transporter [Paenibacillus sp. YPG26]